MSGAGAYYVPHTAVVSSLHHSIAYYCSKNPLFTTFSPLIFYCFFFALFGLSTTHLLSSIIGIT